MASKSKRAREKAANAKNKSAWPVIICALAAAYFGYLQNRYGQFSDIRGFYGTRFFNGGHAWPYDPQQTTNYGLLKPIEYPVITGVAIWLITFITPQSGDALLNYFGLNAFIHAIFFAGTAYFIKKLSDNSKAFLFALAPAAFMALNLNWDMWAVLPMVAAIYYFEKESFTLSAILLGIAVSAKFFPLILLLPITIYFYREKDFKTGLKYLISFLSTWLAFNLPVMLISFEGWKYFYEFSFSRGLGDGSIFSAVNKITSSQVYSNPLYYGLNIVLFLALIIFLFRSKLNLKLSQTAFLTMFCFTYFGKQYSMQYILWLAPLAVIMISALPKKFLRPATYLYCAWQALELVFRITYFKNWLGNVLESRGTPLPNPINDQTYGAVAILRYLMLSIFVSIVCLLLMKSNPVKVEPTLKLKRD